MRRGRWVPSTRRACRGLAIATWRPSGPLPRRRSTSGAPPPTPLLASPPVRQAPPLQAPRPAAQG
eukprot:12016759-Alexandrium_andersonii.AAC.1